MANNVKTEDLLEYLRIMMDTFGRMREQFGDEDRLVNAYLDKMLACKDMVECLIQVPVNLQKNGEVTVGF